MPEGGVVSVFKEFWIFHSLAFFQSCLEYLQIMKLEFFAVSTFNTDYILVKDADFEKSLAVLLNAGYTVI